MDKLWYLCTQGEAETRDLKMAQNAPYKILSVRAKYSLTATLLHNVESLRAKRGLISTKPLNFNAFLSLLGLSFRRSQTPFGRVGLRKAQSFSPSLSPPRISLKNIKAQGQEGPSVPGAIHPEEEE